MGPYSYMALVRTGTLASVMPSVAIRTSNLQIVRRVTQYGAKATGSVAAVLSDSPTLCAAVAVMYV
jgi:hypothetical protein